MRNEHGQTAVELIVWFAIAIVVIVAIFAALGSVRLSSTGQGTHNGYITAVEQEGYIFQNYKVYVKTDNSSSQEDVYCLDRHRGVLAALARAFSQTRKRVTVSYQGVRGFGLGLCQDVQITDITPAQ